MESGVIRPHIVEGVLFVKGRTYKQPIYAHSLMDIRRFLLDSFIFYGKKQHFNHIHSVLALFPTEYFIHMYVLVREPLFNLPTHSTSTKKGTMLGLPIKVH